MGQLRETTFREIAPRQSLEAYVDGVWWSETTAPHVLHILPTTCSTLMTCATPYGKGVVLVGALSTTQAVELEQGNVKMGVWLKPGSRYLFCPSDPLGLRDSVVVGRNMSQAVRDFETSIETLGTWQEKMEYLQDFIEMLVKEKMIVRHAVVDAFVAAVRASSGQATVKELVRVLPLGYRQTLRLIKEYTGFTAKEFLQLHRFSLAARDIDTSERTISVTAAHHRYADHPHFTREFHARVGVVPSAFDTYQAL